MKLLFLTVIWGVHLGDPLGKIINLSQSVSSWVQYHRPSYRGVSLVSQLRFTHQGSVLIISVSIHVGTIFTRLVYFRQFRGWVDCVTELLESYRWDILHLTAQARISSGKEAASLILAQTHINWFGSYVLAICWIRRILDYALHYLPFVLEVFSVNSLS